MTDIALFFANPLLVIAAVFVAVTGAGRLTRIITHDDFPPAVWARIKWDTITKDGPWAKLGHCLWCAGPWVTLVCLLWLFAGLLWVPWLVIAWFAFWGWLGVSYAVSILVFHDEGRD